MHVPQHTQKSTTSLPFQKQNWGKCSWIVPKQLKYTMLSSEGAEKECLVLVATMVIKPGMGKPKGSLLRVFVLFFKHKADHCLARTLEGRRMWMY